MPTTAAAPLGRDEIVDLITVAASTFRHTGHPIDERWNASIREVIDRLSAELPTD